MYLSVHMQTSLDALRFGVLCSKHAPHDPERVLERPKRLALFHKRRVSIL